jgi:hypothetical protein
VEVLGVVVSLRRSLLRDYIEDTIVSVEDLLATLLDQNTKTMWMMRICTRV